MKRSIQHRVFAAGLALGALVPLGVVAQRGGFGGPMQQPQRKILAQFDKNGDKRLDAAERKTAREWLATQPTGGFGGRRGGPSGSATPPEPGRKLALADVKSYPSGTPVYDPATIRTVFLQFEASDWEQELAAFNNTDVDVPAATTIDGKIYKDVGVHFRGMSSYFMVPEGRKRSLNLSFDFADGKQEFNGYKTLNLLNAANDPSFLRAVLYTEIASHYVPAPKMNYMRVAINGESWGLYVNAQQFNKDFTRDFFKSTTGARWKTPGSPGGQAGFTYLGDNSADYKRFYEMTSKEDPKAWADLITVFKVLNETPPEKLEAALSPIFDIDGALKFLAVEVALVNSDGYWARASDYSLYQDDKKVLHIIPHDVNEGMGPEEGGGRRGSGPGGFMGRGPGGPPPGMGDPNGFPPPPPMGPGGFGGRGGFGPGGAGPDLDPLVGLNDESKALRSKLLAVPALRARYLSYVHDIAEKWLDWKTLGPIAQKYHDLIAADVPVDTRKLYDTAGFEKGVESVKEFADARRAYLLKATK